MPLLRQWRIKNSDLSMEDQPKPDRVLSTSRRRLIAAYAKVQVTDFGDFVISGSSSKLHVVLF
jgi:hypothetical protein